MRSRNVASGSSTGVSSKSAPSFAGVHLSIMMPFGTSMNDRRIGRTVSGAATASAGIIASSIGNASAAPAPRSTARRERDLLRITIAHTPHLERRALDDAKDDRRPAVIVRRGLARDLAHHGEIVLLDTAAERVGEKPLGEGLDEQVLLGEEHFAQARGSVELRPIRQH